MLSVVLFSLSSMAQDGAVGLDPRLPIPTLDYERPPPDYSYEIGLHLGYGEITYWKQEIPPWVSFGLRVGWGWNFTETYAHRLGITTLFFGEGPMPIHMSLGIDPQLSWDWISDSGLWIGAGVGGALMLNSKAVSAIPETSVSVGPSGSVRLGLSQTWSRVGRRLFVGVEPRVRYTNRNLGYSASLVVGSGRGY